MFKNFLLVILGMFTLIHFCSEWHLIQALGCADIRGHLHPSRRLIAGFDPNLYISPNFEAGEFTGQFTARGLLGALKKDGVPVPHASTDIASLNLLLNDDNLIRNLLNPASPEYQSFNHPEGPFEEDYIRRNRRILEAAYPLKCPRLESKDKVRGNNRTVLLISDIQGATPSFLVAIYPIYRFPLEVVKPFWFLLTWILFLISVYLLAGCVRWRDGAKIVWMTALFFVVTSYSWDLHIVRGQKYVFYLFMLSGAYYLLEKKKMEGVSGFIIGLLATFRPNVVLMVIPFLLFKKRMSLMGIMAGIFFGIALPVVVAGPSVWESYFTQMKIADDASLESVHLNSVKSGRVQPALLLYGHKKTDLKYGNSYFDGAADDVQKSFLLNESYGSVSCEMSFTSKTDGTLGRFIRSSPFLSKNSVWWVFVPIFLLVTVLIRWKMIKDLFCQRSTMRSISNSTLFLIGTGLVLLSNYFWKVNYLYTDVLWIFPLALIIIRSGSSAYFLKTSFIPVSVFLFFSGFGSNWFHVQGIGIVFGEIIMLIYLPFIILDFLAKDITGEAHGDF